MIFFFLPNIPCDRFAFCNTILNMARNIFGLSAHKYVSVYDLECFKTRRAVGGNVSPDCNLALHRMLNPPHPSWKSPMERVSLGVYAREPITVFFF